MTILLININMQKIASHLSRSFVSHEIPILLLMEFGICTTCTLIHLNRLGRIAHHCVSFDARQLSRWSIYHRLSSLYSHTTALLNYHEPRFSRSIFHLSSLIPILALVPNEYILLVSWFYTPYLYIRAPTQAQNALVLVQ